MLPDDRGRVKGYSVDLKMLAEEQGAAVVKLL
jgi:hypothetical protein